MELVTVQKYTGRYDIFHPRETQIKYSFSGIPKDVCDWASFVFNDDDDFDLAVDVDLEYMPLDFAYDLMNMGDKHFSYWTGKSNIQKIIEYLDTHQDEQYELFAHRLLDRAILKRDCAISEVNELTEIINQINKEK